MEDARGILCADGGCLGDVLTEKGLVALKEPVAHVQLACSAQYCAFPADGNTLCVWSTEDPSHQVSRKACVCFLRSGNTGGLVLACPLLGCPGALQDPLQERCKPCAGGGVPESKQPGITWLKNVLG